MIEIINRPDYTNRIITFINNNIIKVFYRSVPRGKNCLLCQMQKHIEQLCLNANI